MSDGLSIQHRRITNADFRPCSSDRTRSQAPLYVCARVARLPTGPRAPLHSSVTLWEETAPVKLPDEHGPDAGYASVRANDHSGWYFTVGSPTAGAAGSKPPTYPTQNIPQPNISLQSRFMGSFRLTAGTWHLHHDYNFTGLVVETVLQSLRLSCRSELTRQGTSLP